jgi:Domain of unknown function (DUF5069)
LGTGSFESFFTGHLLPAGLDGECDWVRSLWRWFGGFVVAAVGSNRQGWGVFADANASPENPTHILIMSQIVPLISSAIAGPLGVLHLPRLWQKASLAAAGKLHADYPGIGCGYDQMTLDALGINIDTFKAFIATKPSYPQLESWVKAQPGVNLTKGNLYKHNQSILGYIHGDDVRKTILDADGIPDDGSVNPGAVDLNNLDDWHIFWAQEIK